MSEAAEQTPATLQGYLAYLHNAEDQLRGEWHAARDAAGKLFILSPGCSVPNDTKDGELLRLVKVLGA